MTCKEFDKLSSEERKGIISAWSGEKLIEGYEHYASIVTPTDYDAHDTLNLIRDELRKRIRRY